MNLGNETREQGGEQEIKIERSRGREGGGEE